MKKKFYCFTLILFITGKVSSQTVSGFDDLILAPGTYWDGSDQSGGFQNGNAWFPNYYDTSWYFWSSGFAYSNIADSSTSGYGNLYAAKAFKAYGGSGNYALAQQASIIRLTGNAGGKVVSGLYITNTTYAANSMRDGDSFAKKFGGASGNDPDWFKVTIYGYAAGMLTTDSVEFYLADYRFSNNQQDYIVDSWEWVDLTSIGNIDSLQFFLSSSDNGSFGMNTPAFFAIDHFITADSPANIHEEENIHIEVYPNPAHDFIAIHNETNEFFIYTLTDLNGKIILNGSGTNNQILNTGTFEKGLYILKIETREQTAIKKIITQ